MAASFSPTQAELALVSRIFVVADPQSLGIVTGEAAVKVFEGCKLPAAMLGDIWAIADEDNNGFLTRKGVAVAVRLLGHAQKGEIPGKDLLARPAPLPHIEGISKGLAPSTTAGARASTPTSPGFPAVPPFNPSDKQKFFKIFVGCNPVHGLVSGEKARDVFVKSKLPYEKLSRIWSLSDIHNRGSLDASEFAVGMHFIQYCMTNPNAVLPTSVPPDLLQAVGASGVAAQHTGASSGAFAAPPSGMQQALKGQMTGDSVSRLRPQATGTAYSTPPSTFSSRGGSAFTPTTQQSSAGPDWEVTLQEKANADRFFDTIDAQRRGYIEGDAAVDFMMQSKLSQDILAQIWDLADHDSDGRLTREEFALAMHLITRQMSGKGLPTVLPTSLIPPSMRSVLSSAATPTTVQQSEPLKDLLWDETPPQSAAATTSSFAVQPQGTGNAPPTDHTVVNMMPQQQPNASAFTSPQFTGQSAGTPTPRSPFDVPAGTFNRDLLDDDDETAAPTRAVPDNSAEIGNLQNQLQSTQRSAESATKDRENVEQTLASQASHLSQLQTQLSAAKASYETETKLLDTLRERLSVQKTDIRIVRQDLITAESSLSAVRVEKSELEGTVLKDKEEVRDLQRKMKQTNEDITTVKADVERLKKEGRQQKGLLAIARKQLATGEAERARAQAELQESESELSKSNQELGEVNAQIEAIEAQPLPERTLAATSLPNGRTMSPGLERAIAAPLPLSPEPQTTPMISPTGTLRSLNPFDRLNSGESGASPSPFLPFAATSAPTLKDEHDDDPFGLSEAPRVNTQRQEVSSPVSHTENDFFTPPATANESVNLADTADGAATEFPNIKSENAMDKPEVVSTPVSTTEPVVSTAAKQKGKEKEDTDLNTDLKEIEHDESSDSDTEEAYQDARAHVSSAGEVKPATTQPLGAAASSPRSTNAFDDAFGGSPTFTNTNQDDDDTPLAVLKTNALPARSQSPASSVNTPTEPPAVDKIPPPTIETVLDPKVNTAGVNDFDEAMRGLSASSATGDKLTLPKFESSFDDTFNFGSPKDETPAPATASETDDSQATGSGLGTKHTTFTFDDAFGAPSAPSPSTAQNGKPPGLSFEDAFGTETAPASSTSPPPASSSATFNPFPSFEHNEANLADTLNVSAPAPKPHSPPPGPPPAHQNGVSSAPRAESPGVDRTQTPPPRVSSPRGSTSGKQTSPHEKEKESKHSRLSIRFPFGRKGKDKKNAESSAPPLPARNQSSFLAPIAEPTGPGIPASEDDVEPVKQLCNMGFSRAQAVEALEKHGYDISKALNSLVGSV